MLPKYHLAIALPIILVVGTLLHSTSASSVTHLRWGSRSEQSVICPDSSGIFKIDQTYKNLDNTRAATLLDAYTYECQEWPEVRSLTILMRGNNLTSLSPIYLALLRTTKLTALTIDLRFNAIDDEGVQLIDQLLQYALALEEVRVDLSANAISSMQAFRYAFQNCHRLRVIDLQVWGNRITDISFLHSAPFSRAPRLERLNLDFSRNRISDISHALQGAFRGAYNLTTLALSLHTNNITSVSALETAFENLTALTQISLKLFNNQIEDVAPLQYALKAQNALQACVLDVSRNSVTQGVDEMADGLYRYVAQRYAFCTLDVALNANPYTPGQQARIESLRDDMRTLFDEAECTGKLFSFVV